jgi:micrococcal nuclease
MNKKNKKIILLFLIISICLVFLFFLKNKQEPNLTSVLVTKIIDGDTIEIQRNQKIRLIGIDTPESGNCYFDESKNFLSNLILNKQIKLEIDVSETDKYQRLLRYIYLDNILINDYLVSQGYAKIYTVPPDIKYQKLFQESQNLARNENRGLWQKCSDSEENNCLIKGNISIAGEKIYHLPGQEYYDETFIDTTIGEKWFCTETEAQSAGWRKSKN